MGDMKQTYAQWKAGQLNAIFKQRGTGGPARITAATVEHGIEKEADRRTLPHFAETFSPYQRLPRRVTQRLWGRSC